MELRSEESAVLRAVVALCAHGGSTPGAADADLTLTAGAIEKFLRAHDPDVAGQLDDANPVLGIVGILERLWQLDLLTRVAREDGQGMAAPAWWVPTAAAFYSVLGAARVSQGLGRLAQRVD